MSRVRATVFADKPNKEIDQFVGTFTLHALVDPASSSWHRDTNDHLDFVVVEPGSAGAGSDLEGVGRVESLNIDNTLWANTVVCGGGAVGLVVYTGTETRVAMNCDPPKSKVGLVDLEINRLAKMLFLVSFILSVTMVLLKGLSSSWPQV